MTAIQSSATDTYRRLREVGFAKPFVKDLLPSWWTDNVLKSSSGMMEFAGLLKLRFGVIPHFNSDGRLEIRFNRDAAKLKQRVNADADKIQITSALAFAMARIALANYPLPTPTSDVNLSPTKIRASILSAGFPYVSLEALLNLCWSYGIPVLRLAKVPTKSHKAFGYSVSVNGRHAIIVGLNDSRPARISFVIAHELGHILLGHVADGTILADEVLGAIYESLESNAKGDEEEAAADSFALSLLRGEHENAEIEIGALTSASSLAIAALKLSNEVEIDPGHILLSHAYQTRNWKLANLAHRFIDSGQESETLLALKYRELLEPKLKDEERVYMDVLQQYS